MLFIHLFVDELINCLAFHIGYNSTRVWMNVLVNIWRKSKVTFTSIIGANGDSMANIIKNFHTYSIERKKMIFLKIAFFTFYSIFFVISNQSNSKLKCIK